MYGSYFCAHHPGRFVVSHEPMAVLFQIVLWDCYRYFKAAQEICSKFFPQNNSIIQFGPHISSIKRNRCVSLYTRITEDNSF